MLNFINGFGLRSPARVASAFALATVSCGAHAATSWTFDIAPSGSGTQYQCQQNGTSNGNNVTCFKDGPAYPGGLPTVKATAWANTAQTTGTAANNTLEQGYLAVYSSSTGADVGLGIRNKDYGTTNDPGEGSSPEHAIDNNSTNSSGTTLSNITSGIYDMVLMEFSQAVSLNQLTTGWVSTDSDITVMACTTNAGTCASLAGKKYSDLTSVAIGWDYIEHTSAGGTAGTRTFNSGNKTSQYWLIGAYNPTVGGTPISGCVAVQTSTQSTCVGNDAFKLMSVAGNVPTPPGPGGGSAPEPAGMALLGIATAGAFVMRRKARK